MLSHSMRLLSAVMYILSFLAFFCLVGTDVISNGAVSFMHSVKFITALLVFVFGYLGALLKCKTFSDSRAIIKIFRNTFIMLFLAYCFIVIDFTLIDNTFGRNVSSIFSLDRGEVLQYLKENTNLIPFATIRLFWSGYKSGALSFGAMVENILGNFLVLAPFALFLPVVSNKFRKAKFFIPVIAATVIIIELLQLVMLTGSADIDDFILNAAGAILTLLVFKCDGVSRLLSRFSFGVWMNEAE